MEMKMLKGLGLGGSRHCAQCTVLYNIDNGLRSDRMVVALVSWG